MTSLNAQLHSSNEAADSAKSTSETLVAAMESADRDLTNMAAQLSFSSQQAETAQQDVTRHKRCLSESQAKAESAQQNVSRLEQQLDGSHSAAAQKEEELKKLHKTEIESQVLLPVH